jgi:hypothetical protein
METMTITFVLGALSGLFLLGMVYAFIGVLKIQKEIKSINGDLRHLNKQINTIDHEIHRRITTIEEQAHRRMDEILRDLELQREKDKREDEADYANFHQRIDELTRYIDKRFDKAVDGLITRMDVAIESAIEESKIQQEELIKS